MQQNVRKLQALWRRAEKYGPAIIREAQIAVFEVLGRLPFNTADFVTGTKREPRGPPGSEQQAPIFKTDGRPTEWQVEFKTRKVAIFQWSNKFYTVLRIFVPFPVECFSKHPQTRHDILNALTFV